MLEKLLPACSPRPLLADGGRNCLADAGRTALFAFVAAFSSISAAKAGLRTTARLHTDGVGPFPINSNSIAMSGLFFVLFPVFLFRTTVERSWDWNLIVGLASHFVSLSWP